MLAAGVLLVPAPLQAQQDARGAYPPQMSGSTAEVYKTVGDTELKLYIYRPQGVAAGETRPAIVFFFGGGWRSGTPQQFAHQCLYLASRGMIAVSADYRVSSRNGTKAWDSARDAKSAIRWVRANAARLGIDPERIAAAGGSAGGHIAAVAGIVPDLDEPSENQSISSRPNALVLFNPVLVLSPVERPGIKAFDNPELQGGDREAISPYHHVAKNDPPTIIFHGKADTTVPYVTAELFTEKMKAAGNRCELFGFDGEVHGFFNYGTKGNKAYTETLRKTDEFLTSLGYISGKPILP